MKRILSNQKGSAILYSLVIATIMSTTGFFIYNQSITTQKSLRSPRVRSAMQSAEAMVRSLAYQPSSYVGCSSAAGSAGCLPTNMQNLLDALQNDPGGFMQVDGCVPPPPPAPPLGVPCGVRFSNFAFNGGTRTLSVMISYNGVDAVVGKTLVSIVVPSQVLQDAQYICPMATPLFHGFNANGSAKCDPLPTKCAAGSYMTDFDKSTMTPICQTIPPALKDCPGTADFLTALDWTNSATVNSGCQPRVTPQALYGPSGVVTANHYGP